VVQIFVTDCVIWNIDNISKVAESANREPMDRSGEASIHLFDLTDACAFENVEHPCLFHCGWFSLVGAARFQSVSLSLMYHHIENVSGARLLAATSARRLFGLS
jgi:hypothetical protein